MIWQAPPKYVHRYYISNFGLKSQLHIFKLSVETSKYQRVQGVNKRIVMLMTCKITKQSHNLSSKSKLSPLLILAKCVLRRDPCTNNTTKSYMFSITPKDQEIKLSQSYTSSLKSLPLWH
jgi:hypothetical protein